MWRELLVFSLAAIAGALLAGILGWWADTSARNAARFAAARTLRMDLRRVADQLQKGINDKSWKWFVDLSLPSWTPEVRASLAQFCRTEKWDLIEDSVFQINLLDQEKRTKLATLAAADVSVQDSQGQVSNLGRRVLLAKGGQLDEPLSAKMEAVATEAVKNSTTVAKNLNWDRVPSPLSSTKISRISLKNYLRSHVLGLALAVLALAALASLGVLASRQPTTLAERVADSLQSGLAGTTGHFAACEPTSVGGPRFICDIQFQGPTCLTGTLTNAFAKSSSAPSQLTVGAKTKTQCYEQVLAEADSTREEVLAERAGGNADPATEPINDNSIVVKLAA
jgi:hypothetical protein